MARCRHQTVGQALHQAGYQVTLERIVCPGRRAIVLCIWEPAAQWGPGNPVGAIVDALGPAAKELDAASLANAEEQSARGVELARAAGLEVEPLVESGERTADVIGAVADRLDASVVVVGSRGLSGVSTALLGSVSASVVHHARRPVLLVGHEEEETPAE